MELTKENFEKFIKHLQNDNTDDNCVTAEPLFIVQCKERRPVPCGYSDNFEFFSSEDELSFDSIKDLTENIDVEQIDLLLSNSKCNSLKSFMCLSDPEKEEAIESLGYRKVYYEEIWDYVNSHFTKDAAKNFIKRKKHDYEKLRIYVSSQYLCSEWNMIIKGLISGEIGFVEQPIGEMNHES